ncbi:MAG: FAD binding domain-containing protein [Anaerolineae bacterium]
MLNLQKVYKPETLDEALVLLKTPGAAVLAGGTDLIVHRRKDVQAVVDLSGLNLAYMRSQAEGLALGAMTTLSEVAGSPILHNAANGIVAQAAQRTKTSILRNQATIAGTLISEPAGILATALVALEARVIRAPADAPDGDGRGVALVEFLAGRTRLLSGALVTEVWIPGACLERTARIETVARTPQDKPIVSVATSLQLESGMVRAIAIALGGVGESVLRVVAAENRLSEQKLTVEGVEQAAQESAADLNPFADFRGSAEYRREMARVLIARALNELLP